MTEAVLDASVVLKWFRSDGERHVESARALRASFEAGELVVLAPSLLHLEIVTVAGRRWRWGETSLVDLAVALEDLGFDAREPELTRVAKWTADGLTAYDATYVALAEGEATRLITDDDSIVAVAAGIATGLGDGR